MMPRPLTQERFEQPPRAAAGETVSVADLDRDALFALGADWDDLVQNAAEENAYYSPRYAQALLQFHQPGQNVRALAVRKGSRLIGLLPYVAERWRWAGLAEVNVAWTNPYIFSSTPLLSRTELDAAVEALLDAMEQNRRVHRFWLLPACNVDGPVAQAFTRALSARGLACETLNVFDRPVLRSGATFEEHMEAHVSSKRRRELRRNRRRIAEAGELSFRSYTEGAGLDDGLEAFLRIEKSGWKGEQGTALDCTEAGGRFARAALGGGGPAPIGRADMLCLDDVAIAVSMSIQTGRTAFTIKCAFDEAFRAHSAGLLLEEDVIEDFLTKGWADCLDSATQPGHVIQALWNGSVRVGDYLFCVGSSAISDLRRAVQLETSRQSVRRFAKRSLTAIRP
jgi:CelD/BcsL family acetyltransferase involved in cellulose biosynthesis